MTSALWHISSLAQILARSRHVLNQMPRCFIFEKPLGTTLAPKQNKSFVLAFPSFLPCVYRTFVPALERVRTPVGISTCISPPLRPIMK